jgi:hypothetical protein
MRTSWTVIMAAVKVAVRIQAACQHLIDVSRGVGREEQVTEHASSHWSSAKLYHPHHNPNLIIMLSMGLVTFGSILSPSFQLVVLSSKVHV